MRIAYLDYAALCRVMLLNALPTPVLGAPDGEHATITGSFSDVLDANGRFPTFTPPLLSKDRVMDMIVGYSANG